MIKAELALEWIAGKQQEHGWINKGPNQGVVMRVSKGHYISAPHQLKMEPQGLVVAAEELNVRVSIADTFTPSYANLLVAHDRHYPTLSPYTALRWP